MPDTRVHSSAAAPGGLPLLGHGVPLRRRPLEFLEELRDQADVTVFRLGPQRAFLLNDPELVQQVLVRDAASFTKGVLFEKGRQLLGSGLATSEGEFHRRQRRLTQPAFSRPNTVRYAAVMTECALATSARWRDGGVVEVDREMARLTARIATRCLFSTDIARERAEEIERYMGTVFDGAGRRAYAPVDWWYRLPTPGNAAFERARDRLHTLVDDIVGTYRQEGVARDDLLSTLLAARDEDTGEPMTDRQLRDEVVTILAGGTETSASALTWTFRLLAENPAVLRRLREELAGVLGGRPPDHADLRELPYLGAVVQEALRLYPPVWLVPRSPVDDVRVGGVTMPARSQVFFSPYTLHRDARWFPDPAAFDPGRWLRTREDRLPRGAYVPFGLGVRNCVGATFGFAEIALALATLCGHWTLEPVPGRPPRVTALTTLHLDGLRMTTRRWRNADRPVGEETHA